MLKTYDILLDLEKELYNMTQPLFSVSRNDAETVQLNFTIKQDEEPLDLTGTTVELAVLKPSGKTVFQAAEVTDAPAGKAQALLSIQAYLEFGTHKAEIYIRQEGKISVTSGFWFSSREAIMQGAAIDSVNDWSALQNALLTYSKKPIILEGNLPETPPEHIGQIALDVVNERAFIAYDNTIDGWQLIGTGEGGTGVVRWQDILNKPTEFAPAAHLHEIAEVNGLQAALDAASEGGTTEPASTDWGDITNKPATFTPSEHTHAFDAITNKPVAYPPEIHTHDFVDIQGKPATYPPEAHDHDFADITNKPATYPPTAHTHSIEQVEGLQAALDSKQDEGTGTTEPTAHTHEIAEVNGLPAALDAKADKTDTYTKSEIDQMTWNEEGSNVIVENNLTSTSTANALSANQGRVLNEKINTKADATHTHDEYLTDMPTHTHGWAEITEKPATFPAETHTHGWAEITEKPTEFTPAPHTHDEYLTDMPTHTHEMTEVNGLQAALDEKASGNDLAGKADAAHTHSFAEVTDKPATYPAETHTHGWAEVTDKPATFPAEAHTHEMTEVNGLPAALDAKADATDLETKADAAHSHTWDEVTAKPAEFPPAAHTHDEYLTQTEGDARYELKGESGTSDVPAHTHEMTDVNGLGAALDGKADAAHSHTWDEVTEKPATFTPPLASGAVVGGHRVGNGLRMSGEYLTIRDGAGIKTNADTLALDVDRTQTDEWYAAKEALGGLSFWKGTQAEYDAIGTKDPNRIYFVI